MQVYQVKNRKSIHYNELVIVLKETNLGYFVLNISPKTLHEDTRNDLTKKLRKRESFYISKSSVGRYGQNQLTAQQLKYRDTAIKKIKDYVF
jgi:hypothetical protein